MASPSQSKVYFFYEVPRFHLSDRTLLKRFIETIFKREKKELEHLNVIFCSDKRLLTINRDYLQHDYYTDIISFELNPPGEAIVGEIYISIDRVRDNARKFRVSFKQELRRVLFHGALHLAGFRDKSAKEEAQMRIKEQEYLTRYQKFI